jgi:glutamate-1-semialdehyde 2,1-aminomutase
MHEVEKKFRSRTPRSEALAERAARVMPGGETRSAVYHPPYSVVIERGSGSRVYDVDGNDYLDLSNNFTCLVHGHAYPPIVEAAEKAVRNGTTYAAKVIPQIELAELIVDRVESVDEVRFANSGSEGVLSALAIGRGYNGRSKVLVSTYSFHGHLFDARSRGNDPDRPLTPDFIGTYVGRWGDADSFEQILAEHGDEISIVVLEPWLGAGGIVGAPIEFFERVQEAAHRAGALFVLDEATVFRLATGGAQSILGLRPDLTVLGKLIGGGFPCGGIGGRRDLMELANPATGNVHVSGTFSGNPVAMSAGIAAVRDLTPEKIEHMSAQVELIDLALARSASRHALPYSSRRVGSLMNVWFSESLPEANHVRVDTELAIGFHLSCMTNGVFAVPRALINVTTATSDADVLEITERLDEAVRDLASIA